MKKILILMLCAVFFCATPMIVSAEEAAPSEEVVVEESTTEPTEDAPATEVEKTIPEQIVAFITENYTESSLVSFAVTVVVYLFYEIKKHKSLNGSIGVLNNNAVTIAETSATAIRNALTEVRDIAQVVNSYKVEIEALLTEIRNSESEKEALEKTLHKVEKMLASVKLVTMENANEMAELLMLANIPNSKKDEIYKKHLEAVNTLAEVEKDEVVTDDGKEA